MEASRKSFRSVACCCSQRGESSASSLFRLGLSCKLILFPALLTTWLLPLMDQFFNSGLHMYALYSVLVCQLPRVYRLLRLGTLSFTCQLLVQSSHSCAQLATEYMFEAGWRLLFRSANLLQENALPLKIFFPL